MSPFGHFSVDGKCHRVVEVYGHKQAVGHTVGGKDKIVDGDSGVCAVSGNAEETGGVVASCGTHGIDECLHPAVVRGVLGAVVLEVGSPAPSAVVDFIDGLEHQEVAFVGKTACYLCPHGSKLRGHLSVAYRIGRCSLYVEPMC